MPKRSHEQKIERYEKKLRKLREKSHRRHKSSDLDTLTDLDMASHRTTRELENTPDFQEYDPLIRDNDVETEQDHQPEPSTLDSETLQALGEPIQEKLKFGPNINIDLAKRWNIILKTGLSKEMKELLLKEYTIPENCQYLQAPKLNPELLATVSDIIKNRDKKIEEEQQQLGQGITALSKALTILVTNNDVSDRLTVIKTLSEAARILNDLHYCQTMTRKRLITPVLDKKFLELIKDDERDEFLYGGNLAEKIKNMKYAQKSGQTIKKVDNFKPPIPKPGRYNNHGNQGNFNGPPRYQVQRPYNRGGHKRLPSDRNSYKPPQRPMKRFKPDLKPVRK